MDDARNTNKPHQLTPTTIEGETPRLDGKIK
jgi:hypothetical protein